MNSNALKLFFRILFFIHPFILVCPCDGQITEILSINKQKSELKLIMETLDAHPHLDLDYTEEDKATLLLDIESKLNVERTKLDFFKLVAPLVSSYKDGHTSLSFGQNGHKKTRKKNGVFPYIMYLDNENNLYVIDKMKDTLPIPKGSKISHIQGMEVKDFIDSIDKYISYELPSFRNYIITQNFELYLYLAFGDCDSLKFTFSAFGLEEAIVENVTYKEWKSYNRAFKKQNKGIKDKTSYYYYEDLDNGVGYLRINAFVADIDGFSIFLKKTFKHLTNEGHHSLIIDVRENMGGMPKLSSMIFQYITDSYYKTMARSTTKVSYPLREYYGGANNDRLKDYALRSYHNKNSIDLVKVFHNDYDTYFDEESYYNEQPDRSLSNRFHGDVYLLINRNCYSAASSFAATFQCYQMGEIIGEPTGGTKVFHGNAIGKKLINADFILRVASTKVYTACYADDVEPITPDITFHPILNEIVHGVDSQLNYTLLLIKQMKALKEKESRNK